MDLNATVTFSALMKSDFRERANTSFAENATSSVNNVGGNRVPVKRVNNAVQRDFSPETKRRGTVAQPLLIFIYQNFLRVDL